MSQKYYTVLITSNRKGKTKSFVLSASAFKWGLTLLCISLALLSTLSVDYVNLLLQTNENKRLVVENEALKGQFNIVSSKMKTLEGNLERIKSFVTKLKLITNIKDSDRPIKLNMGPSHHKIQDRLTLNEATKDRSPASQLLKIDAPFMEPPPLNHTQGELIQESKDYATISIQMDHYLQETELREQEVLALYEDLIEHQSLLNATPSIQPARGWFSSHFGYRIDPFSKRPEMHRGLDIVAPIGTPIFAPAKGVVSYVGYDPGYGKLVTIDHGYGVKTRYAHNSKIFVELGQKVRRREIIASVGNTGRSTGPHLHYEVRVNGVPVNPKNYILND